MKRIVDRGRPGVPRAHILPITGNGRKVSVFRRMAALLFLFLLPLSIKAQGMITTASDWSHLSYKEKAAYIDGFLTGLYTVALHIDSYHGNLEDIRRQCDLQFYTKSEILRIIDTWSSMPAYQYNTLWSLILVSYGQKWWSRSNQKIRPGGREFCPLGVCPPLPLRDFAPAPFFLFGLEIPNDLEVSDER